MMVLEAWKSQQDCTSIKHQLHIKYQLTCIQILFNSAWTDQEIVIITMSAEHRLSFFGLLWIINYIYNLILISVMVDKWFQRQRDTQNERNRFWFPHETTWLGKA